MQSLDQADLSLRGTGELGRERAWWGEAGTSPWQADAREEGRQQQIMGARPQGVGFRDRIPVFRIICGQSSCHLGGKTVLGREVNQGPSRRNRMDLESKIQALA